jgi:hypothetical protein
VSLDAKRLVASSYLPVQSLMARVQVENGRAFVRPLDIGFGGGRLAGELSVDAATDTPTSRVNLRFDGVELAAFFRGARFFDTTKGRLRGRIVSARIRSLISRTSSYRAPVVAPNTWALNMPSNLVTQCRNVVLAKS